MVRSRQGTPAARRRTGLRRCRDRRRPISEQRVRGRRGYRPPARRSLVRSGIRGTRDGHTHLGDERRPQTRLRQLRRRRRPRRCRADRDGSHAQREGGRRRHHRGRRSRRGSGRPRHAARARPWRDRHRYCESLERRLPAFPRRDPRVLRREPRTADPGRSPLTRHSLHRLLRWLRVAGPPPRRPGRARGHSRSNSRDHPASRALYRRARRKDRRHCNSRGTH